MKPDRDHIVESDAMLHSDRSDPASDAARNRDRHVVDAVLWAYRLILGREPENVGVLARHAAGLDTLEEVRRHFLDSSEFAAQRRGQPGRVFDPALLDAFPPTTRRGLEGFLTDFIGTITRCSYLPMDYAGASGIVEGPPGTERFGLHEQQEWEGTLRSVLEARQRFVAVELGAGWAPWLVASATAARHRGLTDVRLAGVEGAVSHYAFMLQHFRDNALDPDDHLLLHAVVGVKDGVARFPVLPDPSADWGARASFGAGDDADEEVPCIAIPTLLARLPPVDLLHCDVQGAEGEVLPAAIDALTARVRRVVIGTHGRRIEETLMQAFGDAGWALESEQPCRFVQAETGHFLLAADGVQVWRNRRTHVSADEDTP